MKIKKLFNIKDKVVVITGAFGFLGLKFTKLILENEGICILLDKKIQKNNKILKRFDKKKFLALKVDITSEIQVRNASKKIFNHYGKIDSLINNAANNPKVTKNLTRLKGTRLENFPIIDWNNDIDVSLKEIFFVCEILWKFD